MEKDDFVLKSLILIFLFVISIPATEVFCEKVSRIERGRNVSPIQNLFIEPIKFNATVFVGQTAYLPCIVKNVGDKTVSWIRRRDLHILTSGPVAYTSDRRFGVVRERNGQTSSAWTLKILNVQPHDEGVYQCQINTEPKNTLDVSLFIIRGSEDDESSGGKELPLMQHDSTATNNYHLRTDEGMNEAKVLGPLVVEVKEGETANFTCLVSHSPTSPPNNVTWFLNGLPIRFSSRGGISTETERWGFSTRTVLLLLNVREGDEGVYACGGHLIRPSTVTLTITHADKSGGVRGSGSGKLFFFAASSHTFLHLVNFSMLIQNLF